MRAHARSRGQLAGFISPGNGAVGAQGELPLTGVWVPAKVGVGAGAGAVEGFTGVGVRMAALAPAGTLTPAPNVNVGCSNLYAVVTGGLALVSVSVMSTSVSVKRGS